MLKHYLLICSIGIPFIIGYNVVCGILRGLGDSKTPLYFVALACIINVVLDFILVGFFHMRRLGRHCDDLFSRDQFCYGIMVPLSERFPFRVFKT